MCHMTLPKPWGHATPCTAGLRREQETLAIMTTIHQATLRPRALASIRTQSSNCPLTKTAASLGLSHSVPRWAPPPAASSSPTSRPRAVTLPEQVSSRVVPL